MNAISAEAILRELEILPEQAKKEVYDFIEFLSHKRKARKKKIDKKHLLEVSCWNDEDINAVEDAGKEINKWKLETY